MRGYWALPSRRLKGFLVDPGWRRWYRTGDIVTRRPTTTVTRTGPPRPHGEASWAIASSSTRSSRGSIATPHQGSGRRGAQVDEDGVRIRAFVAPKDGATRPSLIGLKRFSAEHLPLLDGARRFRAVARSLPKTSTDKVDYQRLKDLLSGLHAVSRTEGAARVSIRAFAKAELNDDLIARDRGQVFRRELWKPVRRHGAAGTARPETYGGAAADGAHDWRSRSRPSATGAEDGGLVFAICAHLLWPASCLLEARERGAEDRKYLPGLCDGTWSACTRSPSRLRFRRVQHAHHARRPTATGWRINGTKTFISNAPVADVIVVFAVTDKAKGFHGGDHDLRLEKSASPDSAGAEDREDGHPDGARSASSSSTTSTWARTRSSAARRWRAVVHPRRWTGSASASSRPCRHDGAARSRRPSATRAPVQQFGQPIGKFQAIQHKVADMKMRLEASRLLVYRAASMLDKSRRWSGSTRRWRRSS
jgi:alkylation response protein AidB-like acyl-CoA dehydrogenase